jgi:hypothetical protein
MTSRNTAQHCNDSTVAKIRKPGGAVVELLLLVPNVKFSALEPVAGMEPITVSCLLRLLVRHDRSSSSAEDISAERQSQHEVVDESRRQGASG